MDTKGLAAAWRGLSLAVGGRLGRPVGVGKVRWAVEWSGLRIGRKIGGVLGITTARARELVERHPRVGAKASTAAIRPGGSEDGARARSVPVEVLPFPHPNDLRKAGYIIVGSKKALGAQRRRAANRQQDAGLPVGPTPPKRLRRPEASAKVKAPALRAEETVIEIRVDGGGPWARAISSGCTKENLRKAYTTLQKRVVIR